MNHIKQAFKRALQFILFCSPTQAFKWALLFLFFLLFPTFLICSYFSLLFLENALLSLLFTLKCHLRVRIQKFFLAHFARSDFRNQSFFSSRSPPLKHNKKLFLTKKVSLFSQYYYHSSCPAYLVSNFVYLTNDYDDFCTWKSPSIPTFLHR